MGCSVWDVRSTGVSGFPHGDGEGKVECGLTAERPSLFATTSKPALASDRASSLPHNRRSFPETVPETYRE